jgi:hypothetical protein
MLIEYTRWTCPLTPLENRLRQAVGQAGYETGFIEHYILPVVYPAELSQEQQYLLGSIVLVINGAVYGWLLRERLRRGGSSR